MSTKTLKERSGIRLFLVPSKLQEILMREVNLSLTKTIEICQVFEASLKQSKEMQSGNDDDHIHQFNNNTIPRPRPTKQENNVLTECKFCGKSHKYGKAFCPAYGKLCSRCHGRNHFRIKCKRTVNQLDQDEEDNLLPDIDNRGPDLPEKMHSFSLNAVGKSRLTALLRVNDTNVRFQLDTGADINTIGLRFVKPNQITPTRKTLTMWNKTSLKPKGEAILDVFNPKNSTVHAVKFMVVDDSLNCLLGVETVQAMNLIRVNAQCFIVRIASSDDLGNLGVASLCVDRCVRPKVLPCRNIPIAIRQKVKATLDDLAHRKVISLIDESTEWVSQMAVVKKANGDLRICIDPQPLNSALQHEHYKLPVLADILPEFSEAKYFSKLDVKEAYWHVVLDETSSKLITMITPFGRYKWNRLPFGLKVSSEIFQKKLISALAGLKRVFAVADDVVVLGCGKTNEEALANHEENLAQLQKRCEEHCIRLNEEKADLRKTQITFMGHVITSHGIEADPRKVEAIKPMPTPSDVSGVKRFCGMIQYLARFMPNLATDLEPLRRLTRKNTKWQWTNECQQAFNIIKEKIANPPVLAYYDDAKSLVLRVDSSKNGIGAVLLQNGRPIEYASRALSVREETWAQIEKETAIVYGLERFDQYTYGRTVTVCNDHKPLDMILRKPLSHGPKRLQALIMRLNRFSTTFQYVPGTPLFLADTLSRAHPESVEIDSNKETTRVMNVNAFEMIADRQLETIKQASQGDEDVQTLLQVILNDWPTSKDELPVSMKPYFSLRDTLSCEDGIVLKGERVLIPKSLHHEILQQFHSAHLGLESMLRRARASVFWLGMAKDLQQLADNCHICQQLKPSNHKEPLKQHAEGGYPWEKCGVDLFEYQGAVYLVCVDYYSNFIEVDLLQSTTSIKIVNCLRKIFSRYGIPKMIVSDCGPQFVSECFERFCESWFIEHVTSSPGHQRENGKAEAAVKCVKNMLKRTQGKQEDQYIALLELRNTPRQDVNSSPAELVFGRKTRSVIPMLMQPSTNLNSKKRTRRQMSVKRCYDRHARSLPVVEVGDIIYFQSPPKEQWEMGKVIRKLGSRTFIIQNPQGVTYKRNRVHIRRAKRSEAQDYGSTSASWFPMPSMNENERNSVSRTMANEINRDSASRPPRMRRAPARFDSFVQYSNAKCRSKLVRVSLYGNLVYRDCFCMYHNLFQCDRYIFGVLGGC